MSEIALDLPFDADGFTAAFAEHIRPLILEEWPEVDAAALDATGGEPQAVIRAIAAATQHSKVLIRKQLAELAEVAGVGATGLEGRLLRVLHYLEGKASPVQEGAEKLVEDLRERGASVGKQVGRKMQDAEGTLKENLWVTLLGALGLGLLVGLIVGLSRGR
jgi:hypothetical protein